MLNMGKVVSKFMNEVYNSVGTFTTDLHRL